MRLTLNNVVLLAMGAPAMFLAGALLTEGVLLREMTATAQNKDALHVVLAECNYSPHPISDVSWELYRQGLIPLGTAGYYTRTVKSVNIPAAACVKRVLPEHWNPDAEDYGNDDAPVEDGDAG